MIAWEGWWYYETLDSPTQERNLVPLSSSMVWPWFVTTLDDVDDSGAKVLPSPSAPSDGSSASSSVEPGDTCPVCERKMPRPRKDTSPDSTTVSHRLPVDVKPEYLEIRDACIEHLGIAGEKYCVYKMFLTAMISLLQTPHRDIEGRAS